MKLCVSLFMIFFVFTRAANAQESVIDFGLLRPTIVGGEIVRGSLGELRAMVPRIYVMDMSQEFATERYCTGLLIAPNVVLTAAHCVNSDPQNLFMQVYFEDKAVGVTKIVLHPEYKPLKTVMVKGRLEAKDGLNDVALLFLEEKMKFITPALLPTSNFHLRDQQIVIMAGYGMLSFDTPNRNGDLLYVKVRAEEIPQGRLRVAGKQTSCEGDSGGPLLKQHQGRWVSVGIVSMGDCEQLGTHMRTSHYSAWIQKQIGKALSVIEI